MTRGLVLGLELADVASRAKALGDHSFIDGYYLLHEHNGGKDPTAADPFDRWTTPGHDFVNRTGDCIGGASWCGGFDRYQPTRFPLYDGWINTDSMIDDATGKAVCFVQLAAPVPGCFLVAKTGAPGFEHCGHIATIHTVPDAAWDVDDLALWKLLAGTDVAMRTPQRANQPCVAAWWFKARHAGAIFCRSIMTP